MRDFEKELFEDILRAANEAYRRLDNIRRADLSRGEGSVRICSWEALRDEWRLAALEMRRIGDCLKMLDESNGVFPGSDHLEAIYQSIQDVRTELSQLEGRAEQ